MGKHILIDSRAEDTATGHRCGILPSSRAYQDESSWLKLKRTADRARIRPMVVRLSPWDVRITSERPGDRPGHRREPGGRAPTVGSTGEHQPTPPQPNPPPRMSKLDVDSVRGISEAG